jgi:hypothetical protein
MYPDDDKSNSANETTSPSPPKKPPIKKRYTSATRTSAATNYAPPVSSPLSLNPPITFQPPEPPLVFLIEEATSDDNDKHGEVRTISDNNPNMPNEQNAPPIIKSNIIPPVDVDMGDIDLVDTSTPAETPEPIKTAPASPVDKEQVKRDGNHFFRTRKVDRDQLIKNLEIEAASLREELVTAREANDIRGISSYARRLAETVGRLLDLTTEVVSEVVGELDTHQVIVPGLNHILNLSEDYGSPLPHGDPTVIPAAVPSTNISKAQDPKKNFGRLEPPTCVICDEPVPPTYKQSAGNLIPQCPSQPYTETDPRTIPIASRPYFKGGANDFVRRAGGVKSHLIVDFRSLTIIEDGNGDHVPSTFLKHFTELSGSLTSYIFPGRLAPTHDWPLNVPESKAINYKDRIQELRKARRDVETIYQNVNRSLGKAQVTECLRPYITLYKRITENSPQLTAIKMDRIYFWQRLHPVWNPLLKPVEAAFIRGAIYAYYAEKHDEHALLLDKMLRTPHYDDWEIRELVALGALDNEFRESEALAYFQALDNEHWDFHAEEQAFRKSADEILEAMENDDEDTYRKATSELLNSTRELFRTAEDNEDNTGSDTMAEPTREPATTSACRTDCGGFPLEC